MHGNLPGAETGEGMVLQFLAHNRSSLILKITTNAGNWCWSLSFSSCRCFLWRRQRRWWRCDVPTEWMFFPLCFLALSLFSCGLLLWLIPMEENIASLEEKKLETKMKGRRRWRGRAGWSLYVFFCLSSFLLLIPIVFFFAHLFLWFSFPCFPPYLYWEEMVTAAVGLSRGRSGATLTERASSSAEEEMVERGEWPGGGLVLGALSFSRSCQKEMEMSGLSGRVTWGNRGGGFKGVLWFCKGRMEMGD